MATARGEEWLPLRVGGSHYAELLAAVPARNFT